MSNDKYTNPEVLIETNEIADRLNDPNQRLVEVDVDTAAYDSGHIPGAVGWNWKTDTQATVVRDIPSKADFQELLNRSGISPDTTVILYGDNNNWFAAFAFWLLKYYGHQNVKLINGGRKKWLAENRPLTTDAPTVERTDYQLGEPVAELRALRNVVETAVGQAGGALVDVRSPKEFSGELLAPENLPQEGSQRGGHIPGAANIPWASAVQEDGTFKSADELKKLYEGKGITADKDIITYCRIGERSSHTWFALTYLLGYPKVKNYDGSWTEWGSLIGAPIEKG